jgi:hypothetical protein
LPLVVFTSDLEIEKTRKRFLVNGAHAIAAMHAHCFSYRNLDAYYGETETDFSRSPMREIAPPPSVRQRFLRELLVEFSEAFKEAAMQCPTGAAYLATEYTPDEESRYLDSIARRFSETPDSVIRILGSFRGPPVKSSAHLLDYFRKKVVVRILEPYVLFLAQHRREPARMTEGITLMIKTMAHGNYP